MFTPDDNSGSDDYHKGVMIELRNMVRGGAIVVVSLGLASVETGLQLSAHDTPAPQASNADQGIDLGQVSGVLTPTLMTPTVAQDAGTLANMLPTANKSMAPPSVVVPPQTTCSLFPNYFHNSVHNPGDIGIQWTVSCGAAQSSITLDERLYLHYCNYLFCYNELLGSGTYQSKPGWSQLKRGVYGPCVSGQTDSYYSTTVATVVGDGITTTLTGTSGPTSLKCVPR